VDELASSGIRTLGGGGGAASHRGVRYSEPEGLADLEGGSRASAAGAVGGAVPFLVVGAKGDVATDDGCVRREGARLASELGARHVAVVRARGGARLLSFFECVASDALVFRCSAPLGVCSEAACVVCSVLLRWVLCSSGRRPWFATDENMSLYGGRVPSFVTLPVVLVRFVDFCSLHLSPAPPGRRRAIRLHGADGGEVRGERGTVRKVFRRGVSASLRPRNSRRR